MEFFESKLFKYCRKLILRVCLYCSIHRTFC